jgi:hypothetical protein
MGNKDVAQGASMFRTIATMKVWKMVRGLGKNPLGQRNQKYTQWLEAVRYYIGALTRYESSKKIFYAKYDISHSEWYCLLFYYFNEKPPAEFVQGIFAGAFSNSPVNAFTGLKKLHNRGMLIRRGVRRNFRYTISASGQELVDKVLSEYLLTGL